MEINGKRYYMAFHNVPYSISTILDVDRSIFGVYIFTPLQNRSTEYEQVEKANIFAHIIHEHNDYTFFLGLTGFHPTKYRGKGALRI